MPFRDVNMKIRSDFVDKTLIKGFWNNSTNFFIMRLLENGRRGGKLDEYYRQGEFDKWLISA
jgi:hypothetical protein